MKSKEEILNEIELNEIAIENYKQQLNNGKVSQKVYDLTIDMLSTTIFVLKWVIGESNE